MLTSTQQHDTADCAQVVIGVGDANPLVNGTGAKTLLDAGIATEYVRGAEEEQCYAVNKDFFERIQQQTQAA